MLGAAAAEAVVAVAVATSHGLSRVASLIRAQLRQQLQEPVASETRYAAHSWYVVEVKVLTESNPPSTVTKHPPLRPL